MTAFGQKPLLDVLNGAVAAVPPMWLMRQAGRYLPEYRALRAEKGGFLELAYDSDCACEITLQPIRRFGFDGAILFSDILVVPHAMGQDLWFEAGEGPRLAPKLVDNNWRDLKPQPGRLDPIYETVRKVKAALPETTTFLGFAGSPWTVATYMIAGQGSKDHADARTMAYAQPDAFGALIDAVVSTTVDYLSKQIQAGVDVVQLFDSWAGSLSPAQFDRWVIAPNAAIVKALKKRHPGTPIIGFPKGAGAKLLDYAKGVGADAIGIDETIDPIWAHENLPKGLPVQGNLDPMALLAGGAPLEQAIYNIRTAFAGRPHIFNLGHGISQFTPIAHVEKLISLVRGG
jgi:uroporphyrinogen decarboxylase